MRKVSLWWGFAASAVILATGCKSTSSASPTASNSNPVNGSGTRSALVATGNDPLSLNTKTPPPGADLYVSTARVYEANLNFDAAREQYDRAIMIDPACLPALLGEAHLDDTQKEFASADKHYQIAANKHGDVAAVWNDWGMSQQRRGHFEESRKLLAKAVKLQPEKELYRNNLAMLLVVMHQPQEAYHQLAVIETPAVAHFNMATILHRAGDDKAAAYHFAQASNADPNWAQARVWAERLGGVGAPGSNSAIAFGGNGPALPPDPRPDTGAAGYVASREPIVDPSSSAGISTSMPLPSPSPQPSDATAYSSAANNGPTVIAPAASPSYSSADPGPMVTPASGISYPSSSANSGSSAAEPPLPPGNMPPNAGAATDNSPAGLTPFPPVR